MILIALVATTAAAGELDSATAATPPVDEHPHFLFDHVAVVVDPATVQAMGESTFLRDEFSNSRYRTGQQVLEGGNESGFYMYGALNYLEIVDDVPAVVVETGDGMAAFNAEVAGSVEWLMARMSELYPESSPSYNLRYLLRGEERIPYSHTALFHYEGGHEGFGAWAMEYHQEFKNRMSGGRAPSGDISRHKSAPTHRHHPDKYFQDVVSVTAAVPEARRANLVNLLTVMGYEIEERESATVCTGAENVVTLVPRTDQAYAVTRVRVSLTRPKEGQRTYRFGPDVVLEFGDDLEAVWEFGGTSD